MARPTNYPEWATADLTNGSLNNPNKVEPSAAFKLSGVNEGEDFYRQFVNYNFDLINDWVVYFDGDGGANLPYRMTVYDTAGASVHTPNDNTKVIKFTCIGAGGGAVLDFGNTDTNASGGGGGGGSCVKVSSDPSTSYNIVVGAGGSAVLSSVVGTSGNDGGDTTVGSLDGEALSLTANGGGASSLANTAQTTGGVGGEATGGDLNFSGGLGQGIKFISGVLSVDSPQGGSGIIGGAIQSAINVTAGVAGSGATGGLLANLDASDGIVIVEEWS